MTQYTSTFGGANIYPADVSYQLVETAESITFFWPLDAAEGVPLMARIMDVDATDPGVELTMPDATQVSPGETVVFTNVGAEDFVVLDNGGTQILSVEVGTSWQLYLTSNADEDGSWRSFQFGALVSQAQAAILAGSGLKAVGLALEQSMPVVNFNSNYVAGLSDSADTFVWTGTGSGTLGLPDPGTVGNSWFIAFRNSGGGTVVLSKAGATIDGEASKSYPPGSSSFVVTDGVSFFTLGYNPGSVTNFDYTVIDVSGSGNYTLTGSELNRIAYRFTGTLTGDRNIIVPPVAQQYWVDNQTTGAYDLMLKTASGSGIVTATDARRITYCDGVDVVDADTTNFSVPLSVAQGGTGSTTQSGARINLGGTSVGIGLFTAADQAAAWAVLGPVDGGEF